MLSLLELPLIVGLNNTVDREGVTVEVDQNIRGGGDCQQSQIELLTITMNTADMCS